jgi:ketosteroid isomerase-like protein
MIGAFLVMQRVPAGIEALNRKDLDAFLKDWAEDAILEYPGKIPGVGGIYEGKAAIQRFYQRDFEQFPELKITLTDIAVTNIFDFLGNNVVFTKWEADVTNRDGYRLQNSGITVMKIKRGKAVHVKQYIFDTGEEFSKAWGVKDLQE